MEIYQPLSREGREFRIVRIAPGQQGSPIELTLEHSSLDHAPSYAALSYVWGEEKEVDVRVNGITTSIRENLHEALVQIRNGGLELSTSLWIDAICINQSDDAERSWQVNEMRTIFSQASLVYNWLGPEADDSDAAMKLLNHVGSIVLEAGHSKSQWTALEQCLVHGDLSLRGSPDQQKQDHDFLLKLWQSPGIGLHETSKAFVALLHREYFCRVWVIQELALATQGVVLCGNRSLPLAIFDAALQGIYLCIGAESRQLSKYPKEKNWSMFSMTYFHLKPIEVRRAMSSGSPSRLWDILQVYYKAPGRPVYMASDPRDVVFGLLGCAADTATLNIQADYTQTVAEVFSKVTKALLDHCPDYPLGYCTFPKKVPGLPSWVPDWKLQGEIGIRVYPASYRIAFKASRRLTQPLGQTQYSDWNVLSRQGCHVETVTAVMERPKRHTGSYMRPKTQPGWLKEVIRFCELHAFSSDTEDAVWCSFSQSKKSNPEWLSLAPKVFRGEHLKLEDLTPEQIEYIKSCTPDLNLFKFVNRCLSDAEVYNRGKTLFKTTSGSVGLGSEQMVVDDIVVILWGCNVPIILRPLANHQYSYIGEAYVHGIMYGEFLDTNPAPETFDIV